MAKKYIIVKSNKPLSYWEKENWVGFSDSLSVKEDCFSDSQLFDEARTPKTILIVPSLELQVYSKIKRPKADKKVQRIKDVEKTEWWYEATGVDRSIYNGRNVIAAILDDGLFKQHEAFKSIREKIKGHNFLNKNDVFNFSSHGTACTSVIFGDYFDEQKLGIVDGNKVERVLIGVVRDKEFQPLLALVKSLIWSVNNGAEVVSMSFGKNFNGVFENYQSRPSEDLLDLEEAFWDYLTVMRGIDQLLFLLRKERNTVFFASAGNDSFRSPKILYSGIPALAENIISIGAININGDQKYSLATRSNRGVSFLAPGSVDVADNSEGEINRTPGTSVATPFVAGIAMMWIQMLKEEGFFNYENLIYCLRESAITNTLEEKYNPFDIGYGLVQAPTAANKFKLLTKLKQKRRTYEFNYEYYGNRGSNRNMV